MPLILEGLVTTQNAAGKINLAPMGPLVDRALTQLKLRPFRTSQTYQNLKQHPAGVLQVSDDVLLFAQATIGELQPDETFEPAKSVTAPALVDACRWLEFQVEQFDDAEDRTTLHCRVVNIREGRPFFGFNRAKHAVLEAAILASRVAFLPADEIQTELAKLAIIVSKTAGEQEEQAFALLSEYMHRKTTSRNLSHE